MALRGMYKDSIKSLTLDIIQEYIREMGWTKPEQIIIDLREIYEIVLYPRYECQLITDMDLGDHEDRKVLGKFVGKDRVVLVDKSISPPARDARFTFTLGHEFGHAVLHPGGHRLFRCNNRDIFSARGIDLREIQANIFSENLIMPDWIVLKKFQHSFQLSRPIRYIGPGRYCLCAHGVDRYFKIKSYADLCHAVSGLMVRHFSNISKQSMSYKVQNLGIVVNCTHENYDPVVPRPGNVFESVLV